MGRIIFIPLLLLTLFHGQAQQAGNLTKALSQRYWYLIPSPASPLQWDHFRKGLHEWKDSLLAALPHSEDVYPKTSQWASTAYSVYFLMANDLSLYDDHWNYQVKKCINKYEKNYGGIDVVLLWATYPQLGFDNRDQYTFYRNLPGGTAALKKLSAELHAMGKKFFIAYNPWDNIARNNGKNDEEELISLVQETGADGIFLDTISGVAGFRKKLEAASPGVVFQSEMSPDPEMLPDVQQSWMEVPVWNYIMKNTEYDEVPYILRSRWLQQRHMVYHLSRWSHEQSGVLQNAWMNGSGIVMWENVFGTMNPLNARDRSTLRLMMPVMRRYSDFFTQGTWYPLFPTHLQRTYASSWQFGHQKLWTIINRQQQETMGPLLELNYVAGTRYFDLIAGEEAKTDTANGKTWVSLHLKPGAIGGILAMNEQEADKDFIAFLHSQATHYRMASSETSYRLPAHILKTVRHTKKYSATNIPAHMICIAVPQDSILTDIHFRQRECGFYPAEGVTDISYTMTLDQPGVAHRKIKLHPFAMDETTVTNSAFEKFLLASHYRPAFTQNFLAGWINGHPRAGEENHPVTWVNLDDARAYAHWAGKRLPTEDEWQWAAQGGQKKLAYPWGNRYDSTLCNHGQTHQSTDVKQFVNGKTADGLFDMCGNVWQWTESERNDGHNRYCIIRGGSWYITDGSGWYADQGPQRTNFGSKYLFTWPGLDRCATVGFRCVVDTAP